jgi:carboxypeptidase Q
MITRRDAELVVTGGRRPTSAEFFDNIPTMPQITMTASSYDAIAKNLREGKQVTLEFDIRNYFKKGPIPLYNVVADIRGSELPDEYVIVCGHLDSWDAGTGTTDNGTGCATTIEAARILMASGVRPKRTIRFILWSGEEQGLLGSRAYVEANPELMKKISGVLNHDVGTQYISSIKSLVYQRSDMEHVFAPVMTLNPEFPFRLEPVDSLVGLGSDHASFNRVGVPGFIWGQAGELANYRDTHHTQLDTYDRAVPAYQEHSSIVVALAAYGIANLDHMLARAGEDETEE